MSAGKEWERLAEKISKALYGPVESQVKLPGGEIADIVVWDSSIRKDSRGNVVFANRIIECKLKEHRPWDHVIGKYSKYCHDLEIWYLNSSLYHFESPLPKTPDKVSVMGPYELFSKLCARGMAAKNLKADWDSRIRLAREMWSLIWKAGDPPGHVIVYPRRLRIR